MKKIRLLIVEDSAFLRSSYQRLLSDVDTIEIIDTAKNGEEAVEKAIVLKPDVITMDIEMPVMNGLDAVSEIMDKMPTSILMVSSLTSNGAEATIEALNRGAVDFIPKETAFAKISSMKEDMVAKITKIGSNTSIKNRILRRTNINKESSQGSGRVTKTITETKPSKEPSETLDYKTKNRELPTKTKIKAISIGISTGGPISLQKLLPKLSKNINVPIFVVQHMPPNFTKSLADRLDKVSNLKVKEAISGELIENGTIYFAPGGMQMLVSKNKIVITEKKPDNELYSPSFNISLGSQIHNYGDNILAIVMTGMGNDGTNAMKKLHEVGGYNIAQDPDTCVVSGMPSSAIKGGIIHKIVGLDEMHEVINSIFD